MQVKIDSPVKAASYEKVNDELLGKAFYFSIKPDEHEIKSVISGKILRIFNEKAVLVQNVCQLQVIIMINTSRDQDKKLLTINKKLGDKIKKGEALFSCEKKFSIDHVVIYIPWQPYLIEKIKDSQIYFKNPFSKLVTKLHGTYTN